MGAQIARGKGGRGQDDQPGAAQKRSLDPAQGAGGGPPPQHHAVDVQKLVNQPRLSLAGPHEPCAQGQHLEVAGQHDLGGTDGGRDLPGDARPGGQDGADPLDHAAVGGAPQHGRGSGQGPLPPPEAGDPDLGAPAAQHLDPPPDRRIIQVMGQIGHVQDRLRQKEAVAMGQNASLARKNAGIPQGRSLHLITNSAARENRRMPRLVQTDYRRA